MIAGLFLRSKAQAKTNGYRSTIKVSCADLHVQQNAWLVANTKALDTDDMGFGDQRKSMNACFLMVH
jgi:hypothetical protein